MQLFKLRRRTSVLSLGLLGMIAGIALIVMFFNSPTTACNNGYCHCHSTSLWNFDCWLSGSCPAPSLQGRAACCYDEGDGCNHYWVNSSYHARWEILPSCLTWPCAKDLWDVCTSSARSVLLGNGI